MSLMDKLKKNSTIKDTSILTESKFFQTKDLIQTSVPALNVALSGRLDGGLTPGLTVFAGPSKHFKTAFSLLLAKSYLDKYDDAIVCRVCATTDQLAMKAFLDARGEVARKLEEAKFQAAI